MPVVSAVGIAVAHGSENPRAKQMAEVMRLALVEAQTKGITDPEVLRGVMLAARDGFLEGK